MKHPDLKALLWGRHLHRLLGVFGFDAARPEPAPRLVQPTPVWFQRLAAALTLFGIVGLIYSINAALRIPEEAQSLASGPGMSFDASAWQNWSSRFAIGIPSDSVERAQPAASSTPSPEVPEHRPTRLTPISRLLRPPVALAREHRFQLIQVTAYTSELGETDDTPDVTATNTTPTPGTLALSRDLLRTFTPGAPFAFGDKVLIPGVGVFEVKDTMHPRWKRKADIWMQSVQDARAWGRRTVFVTRLSRDAATVATRVSSRPPAGTPPL